MQAIKTRLARGEFAAGQNVAIQGSCFSICLGFFERFLARCTLSPHLFYRLPMSSHHVDQRAGGPGEGEETGDANDGANQPPGTIELHGAHSQCGVRIGTEVNVVVEIYDEAQAAENERPDENLCNLEKEHQKDAPAKDECGAGEMGAMSEQACPPSVLADHNAVESGSVDQDDRYQDDGADDHGGEWLIVFGNLLQQLSQYILLPADQLQTAGLTTVVDGMAAVEKVAERWTAGKQNYRRLIIAAPFRQHRGRGFCATVICR